MKSGGYLALPSSFLLLLFARPTLGQSSEWWPIPQLPYPTFELSARLFLWKLGCEQDWMGVATQVFFHPLTFLFIVAILTIGAIWAHLRPTQRRDVELNVGSIVLAVSVLLAVFQWHTSLEQDAMQRYESEITNANGAENVAVAKMLPHLYLLAKNGDRSPNPCETDKDGTRDACETARTRFVYIYLDNLEYAIERYRDGFASAQTTVRAVMTFAIHCRETDFKARAQQQVLGYSPLVQRVATAVFNRT
jgi:hypothetical protein